MQNSNANDKKPDGRSILFICAANINRSTTAEIWFSMRHPGNSYQSAGASRAACRIHGGNYVTESQLKQADRIICMDNRNRMHLENEYGNRYSHKTEVAHIPDAFKFLELNLIFEIIDKIKIE
jgi:predicted protein tyrosine phosphatase